MKITMLFHDFDVIDLLFHDVDVNHVIYVTNIYTMDVTHELI